MRARPASPAATSSSRCRIWTPMRGSRCIAKSCAPLRGRRWKPCACGRDRHRATWPTSSRFHGVDLFDAALADSRGLIVAAPHMGNWELLNQWLAMKTPLAILYRPPESPTGEAFLRRVRANAGGQVEQVRAEASGVRTLLKRLQKGGVIGILPDQQPKVGDGEFAPFFECAGADHDLAGSVGRAQWCAGAGGLVRTLAGYVAAALRPACAGSARGNRRCRPRERQSPRSMRWSKPLPRRDLAQYQWTYKRYTLRPPGSGEVNPYTGLP